MHRTQGHPSRRPQPISAIVQPLPFLSSSPLLFSHSHASTSTAASTAFASEHLWQTIHDCRSSPQCGEDKGEVTEICVAVEWNGMGKARKRKGKAKSLVVWVKKATVAIALEAKLDRCPLYIHPSLIPPFSTTPFPVTLHHHRPAELSLVILQPLADDSYEEGGASYFTPGTADLDLSALLSEHSRPDSHSHRGPNAHITPIIRQGSMLDIPLKPPPLSHQPPETFSFKILLLEPVHQGILSPSTQILISGTPFHPDPSEPSHLSSDSRSHISLADFDPDTFLSSSLSISLPQPQPDGIPEGPPLLDSTDLANSVSSSTSGSLTPRPPGHILEDPSSPPVRHEEVLRADHETANHAARFTPVRATSTLKQGSSDDVCWLGVGGLGRAGIFEGDWVLLRSASSRDINGNGGRLVKALAWERLDEPDDDTPADAILLPPTLFRALADPSSNQVSVLPTPFGARPPTMPIARTITLARVATSEAVDKRFEKAWLKGLKAYFERSGSPRDGEEGGPSKLVRRGDIISIPVYPDQPLSPNDPIESDVSDDESDMDRSGLAVRRRRRFNCTELVYFTVTSFSYDPLIPLEDDFRSSITSQARAGELGCWVQTGKKGSTKMVLAGVEQMRVDYRQGDKEWHSLDIVPPPFAAVASKRLRDLLGSCFFRGSAAFAVQLSILVKGARGVGKRSLIRSLADQLGFSIIDVECYDVVGDTPATTSGTLLAKLDKAKACAPALLVLHHIEALAKKTESTVLGRAPPIVNVLEDILKGAGEASIAGLWPVVVVGSTADVDAVPNEVLGCFKQEIELGAPNEDERLLIARHTLAEYDIAPDVELSSIARQTAALNAGDITALIHHAYDLALQRATHSSTNAETRPLSIKDAQLAGLSITAADMTLALDEARSSYSDSIGAPKIPNVTWDDVGSLGDVKQDILDTIQLPLDHPELFGEGLKKRSGILLYGPPGTGKTLLAKAVATSCSLNFLSVKGPELLNMYIGESEANVRRIFQKARDAAPCVIFMDELDSVAPKRGNQGDSGGVMDRIVSQLLAELDGMSSSSPNSTGGGGGVFVMGATNRPDLLDPALLRPGRFDKLLYLSLPSTHDEQASILRALTRKFKLDPSLDLADIARLCPFNYTGADLYALCADAMLGAMMRSAESVDEKIALLNATHQPEAAAEAETMNGDKEETVGYSLDHPHLLGPSADLTLSDEVGSRPRRQEEVKKKIRTNTKTKTKITPQYYLAKLAQPHEMEVRVTQQDFEKALERLVPSVSEDELRHYERVQREFKG